MQDYIYDQPITNEIYCFASRAGDKYYTLMLSPLFKHWLLPHKYQMRCAVGEQQFIAETDKPMYLIPYDCSYGKAHTLETLDLDMFPSQSVNPDGGPKTILVPMVFSLSITPYFTYKIDGDKLYKREDNKWNLVQLT